MKRAWAILPILLVPFVGSCSDDSAPPPVEYRTPPPPAQPLGKLEVSIEKAPPKAPGPEVPGQRLARDLTEQFYRGELEPIHARFSPEMKASMSLDHLRRMREHMTTTYGKETRLIQEKAATKEVVDASGKKEDYRGFVRWARFDKYDGVVEVLWILRPDDTIGGFFLRPAEPPQEKSG